jgi:hypothetical protein
VNGVASSGTVGVVQLSNGFSFDLTANPLKSRSVKILDINGPEPVVPFGVNSHGTVVGGDGNSSAFFGTNGELGTFIPPGARSATKFGINDRGVIVGQYLAQNGASPGFFRTKSGAFITVAAPT